MILIPILKHKHTEKLQNMGTYLRNYGLWSQMYEYVNIINYTELHHITCTYMSNDAKTSLKQNNIIVIMATILRENRKLMTCCTYLKSINTWYTQYTNDPFGGKTARGFLQY